MLSHVTQLMRKHINFDLSECDKVSTARRALTEVFGWMCLAPQNTVATLAVSL